MLQLKRRGHPETPPAIATDGKGSYREAMVEVWGKVPEIQVVGDPRLASKLSLVGNICR